MDNQQVLEQVLKNYAKSDKELYASFEDMNDDEIKQALKQIKLAGYAQRDSFSWELQSVIETCIAENGGAEDSERLAEIVMEKWDQSHEPKISTKPVLAFMFTLNLKFPNTRKALVAICDGDLQSYKTFNSKPKLFIDLLLRFLTCVYSRQENTYRTLEEAAPLLFEEVGKSDYQESIGRVGFRGKKGLNYGKMNAYHKTIGMDKLVYAEGMKSILLEAISEKETSESLRSLKKLLTEVVVTKNGNSSEVDFEVEDLFDATVSEINELVANDPIEENKPPYNGEAVIEQVSETALAFENDSESFIGGIVGVLEDIDSDPKKSLVSSLENALSAVNDALTQATQLTDTKETVTDDATQQQLSIAEDEIKRLKLALEQEKEKVAQQEEKAFKKILQAIGGESSNYLLSDLYEESQGKMPNNPNISAGRLINLFSSLSLAIGLEEHSNFHEIGDVFTIQKDELIKNYRIDGPIVIQSDEIKVKLLKYGWSINGKVVVQPLVEEVKGEK